MDVRPKIAAFSESRDAVPEDEWRHAMMRLLFILVAAIGLIGRADAQAVRRDSAKAFQKVRAMHGPDGA